MRIVGQSSHSPPHLASCLVCFFVMHSTVLHVVAATRLAREIGRQLVHTKVLRASACDLQEQSCPPDRRALVLLASE